MTTPDHDTIDAALPYSEGVFARQTGQPITSNPYRAGSWQHRLWARGWNAADDHINGR